MWPCRFLVEPVLQPLPRPLQGSVLGEEGGLPSLLFSTRLAPIPGRKLVADLIAEIELEAAARRRRTGSQVLGSSAVQGQHPFDRPKKTKRSPAPLFHAASKAVRRELYAMYGWFVATFREAAEKLRAGDRTARFLAGSFPPALPFVAA